jgi:hypothetical protein
MTLAPKPGKYIVGDAEVDGHTHIVIVGPHPMDSEPHDESISPLRGDFPRATTTDAVVGTVGKHAHTIDAHPTQDDKMICGYANDSAYPHVHTVFKKVPDNTKGPRNG